MRPSDLCRGPSAPAPRMRHPCPRAQAGHRRTGFGPGRVFRRLKRKRTLTRTSRRFRAPQVTSPPFHRRSDPTGYGSAPPARAYVAVHVPGRRRANGAGNRTHVVPASTRVPLAASSAAKWTRLGAGWEGDHLTARRAAKRPRMPAVHNLCPFVDTTADSSARSRNPILLNGRSTSRRRDHDDRPRVEPAWRRRTLPVAARRGACGCGGSSFENEVVPDHSPRGLPDWPGTVGTSAGNGSGARVRRSRSTQPPVRGGPLAIEARSRGPRSGGSEHCWRRASTPVRRPCPSRPDATRGRSYADRWHPDHHRRTHAVRPGNCSRAARARARVRRGTRARLYESRRDPRGLGAVVAPAGKRKDARAAAGRGGTAPTRSEAEERFVALIRKVQLPMPAVNTSINGHGWTSSGRQNGLSSRSTASHFTRQSRNSRRTGAAMPSLRPQVCALPGLRGDSSWTNRKPYSSGWR